MTRPARSRVPFCADDGNAVLEFLLVPLLVLPLVVVAAQVLARVRLESALDEAARSATRAYAVMDRSTRAAVTVAQLTLADRGVQGRVNLRTGSPPLLTISAQMSVPISRADVRSVRVQVLR